MENNRKELTKGQVLFKEGDKPDHAYLIEHGEIEVSSNKSDEKIILGVLNQGDILGEMAVIDNAPRSADAIAITDCTLVVISKDQVVERLVKSDPIIRSLLTSLLRRYRSTLATLKGQEEVLSFADTNIFERITIDKIRLEGQLRSAIANQSLDLRFQPILDIAQNKIAGFEALVRWEHPEHGFISPDEFVSLAEETSLIVEVGEYVIDQACEAIKLLADKSQQTDLFMAINVSARQLSHPGLIDRVIKRVEKANLPDGSLKLEITEGLALDSKDTQRIIQVCHQNGIKVALDDFGTGYSNLTLLHKLKFDTIKIDQAFARGIVEDSNSMILVKTIATMCEKLGANALVEGIETELMLEIVAKIGIKYGQGYFIGMPKTINELLEE